MTEIGAFVKLIRKKYGLTLRQMQDKSGLWNTYIYQIENGNVQSVSIRTIRKICKAFPLYEPDILLAFGIKGYFIETQPTNTDKVEG